MGVGVGMNDNETETLWIAAFRYYAGRRTYAVSDFCALLIAQWPTLPQKCRFLIERELESCFERDDESRRNSGTDWALGMSCDRAEWDKVRALWKGQP